MPWLVDLPKGRLRIALPFWDAAEDTSVESVVVGLLLPVRRLDVFRRLAFLQILGRFVQDPLLAGPMPSNAPP